MQPKCEKTRVQCDENLQRYCTERQEMLISVQQSSILMLYLAFFLLKSSKCSWISSSAVYLSYTGPQSKRDADNSRSAQITHVVSPPKVNLHSKGNHSTNNQMKLQYIISFVEFTLTIVFYSQNLTRQ